MCNWPSSQVTLLRPVYTKNKTYKGNYISVFSEYNAVVSSVTKCSSSLKQKLFRLAVSVFIIHHVCAVMVIVVVCYLLFT